MPVPSQILDFQRHMSWSFIDWNDFLYDETLPLYCLSSFLRTVCHPSILLSVILPLYFLSSFHMWLSNTLLVCSRISQKSAQLWQNNIKQWRSSTQLISTTRVSPSLNSLNTKKTTTYDVENPGSDLEQASNGWQTVRRKDDRQYNGRVSSYRKSFQSICDLWTLIRVWRYKRVIRICISKKNRQQNGQTTTTKGQTTIYKT
jgi:hypothetical protein